MFHGPSAEGQEYDEGDEGDAAENSPRNASASRFAPTKASGADSLVGKASEAETAEREVQQGVKNDVCVGVDVELGDAIRDHDARHPCGFGGRATVL